VVFLWVFMGFHEKVLNYMLNQIFCQVGRGVWGLGWLVLKVYKLS
jgi:hypothetical protein